LNGKTIELRHIVLPLGMNGNRAWLGRMSALSTTCLASPKATGLARPLRAVQTDARLSPETAGEPTRVEAMRARIKVGSPETAGSGDAERR
jgi:hypothetical protein